MSDMKGTQGSAHLPRHLSPFQLCRVILKVFLLFTKRERGWFHGLTQLEGAWVAQTFHLPGEFLSDAVQTQLFPSSCQLSSAFRTTEKTTVWEGVWQLSLLKCDISTTFSAHPDYAVLKFMLLLSSWVTVSGSRSRLSLTVGKDWQEMSPKFSASPLYFLMPLDGRDRGSHGCSPKGKRRPKPSCAFSVNLSPFDILPVMCSHPVSPMLALLVEFLSTLFQYWLKPTLFLCPLCKSVNCNLQWKWEKGPWPSLLLCEQLLGKAGWRVKSTYVPCTSLGQVPQTIGC